MLIKQCLTLILFSALRADACGNYAEINSSQVPITGQKSTLLSTNPSAVLIIQASLALSKTGTELLSSAPGEAAATSEPDYEFGLPTLTGLARTTGMLCPCASPEAQTLEISSLSGAPSTDLTSPSQD